MIAAFLWAGLILFAAFIGARVWRDCTKPIHRNHEPEVDQ